MLSPMSAHHSWGMYFRLLYLRSWQMGLLLCNCSQLLRRFGGYLQMLSITNTAATASYLACEQHNFCTQSVWLKPVHSGSTAFVNTSQFLHRSSKVYGQHSMMLLP